QLGRFFEPALHDERDDRGELADVEERAVLLTHVDDHARAHRELLAVHDRAAHRALEIHAFAGLHEPGERALRQRAEQRFGARLLAIGDDALDRDLVEEQAEAIGTLVDHDVADEPRAKRRIATRAWMFALVFCDSGEIEHRAALGTVLVAVEY